MKKLFLILVLTCSFGLFQTLRVDAQTVLGTCKCAAKNAQKAAPKTYTGSFCDNAACSCFDDGTQFTCAVTKTSVPSSECLADSCFNAFGFGQSDKKFAVPNGQKDINVWTPPAPTGPSCLEIATKELGGANVASAQCADICPEPNTIVKGVEICTKVAMNCCAVMKGTDGKETSAAPKGDTGSSITLVDPLGGANIYQLLNRIINTFLGIAGSIALLAFVYGGFLYMISDDAKGITQARDIMVNTFYGLVILIFAYTITNFFLDFITKDQAF